MLEKLAVLNGNVVNRYGFAFPVETLESALNQSWDLGVPSCISHDLHRLVGWTKGMSLYIEPGMVRLVGLIFVPENINDENELFKIFEYSQLKRTEYEFEPHRAELQRRLSPISTDNALGLISGCAAFIGDNLALDAFPDIFKLQDEEDLIPLSSLNQKGPGVFEIDGLLIFAHPFFRRSLSCHNSLNSPFLSIIHKITRSFDLNIKIALDPNMVGLASTYKEDIELEYWWGPKFNDELSVIDFGVTKHVASKDQRLFHGISATEFWWHRQNEITTFECEEIRDIPSFGLGNESFGCRYVHSMLDVTTSIPIHIDGAIRLYDEISMINRMEYDISKNGKNTQYKKLWRIDGTINVSLWKELLTHYFRDNHLVGEYLGGRDSNEINRPHEISSNVYISSLADYVPCYMQAGNGVRISVSYHNKSKCNENMIVILPKGRININNEQKYYIEYDTIKVINLLKRKGYEVSLPQNILLIAFGDMLINMPLIHHSGNNSTYLARETQRVIGELCETWCRKRDNQVVSLNIGVEYDDRDVYYSIAGHVIDLVKWFQYTECNVADCVDNIGAWCSRAANILTDNFSISFDNPPLHDLLKHDGLLYFDRQLLTEVPPPAAQPAPSSAPPTAI
jgi:hypothetical protein